MKVFKCSCTKHPLTQASAVANQLRDNVIKPAQDIAADKTKPTPVSAASFDRLNSGSFDRLNGSFDQVDYRFIEET